MLRSKESNLSSCVYETQWRTSTLSALNSYIQYFTAIPALYFNPGLIAALLDTKQLLSARRAFLPFIVPE